MHKTNPEILELRPPINNHHQPNPADKWHALVGDPAYTDAILDRIVHNAYRINLTRLQPAARTFKQGSRD